MNPNKQTKEGTGEFNKPFFDLRDSRGWSQNKMGAALGGYEGHTIMRIENGISAGKLDLWRNVQKTFNIPDENMWALINGRENNDGQPGSAKEV